MKLLRCLSDKKSVGEVITICEDLQNEGKMVVLEHKGDRIRLYEVSETGLGGLKRIFSRLSQAAPPGDSPHWDEYEETMREMEAELRDKGVDL